MHRERILSDSDSLCYGFLSFRNTSVMVRDAMMGVLDTVPLSIGEEETQCKQR